MSKHYAEIDGKMWEATYPLCGGCEQLEIGNGWQCGFPGNGCKYPEIRTRRPETIYEAFFAAVKRLGVSAGAFCEEIGPQREAAGGEGC